MRIKTIEQSISEQGPELELSPDEISDVIHIVDIGPKHLDKITSSNIKEIITEGEKQLIELRKQSNKFSPNQLPSEVLKDLSSRSSMSHAIQCSVNGTEDFKVFQQHFNQYVGNERKNKFIEGFLTRHIEMGKILAELYKIDIARRIGLAKNEKIFFEQEKPNFIELVKELKNSIDKFKDDNKGKITKFPKLQKTITDLKTRLGEVNYGTLNKVFYSEICQKYSELIFSDFELLNEAGLKKTVKKMEE